MNSWNEYEPQMKEAVTSALENITFSMVDDLPDDFKETAHEYTETTIVVSVAEKLLTASIKLPEEFLQKIIETLYTDVSANGQSYQIDTIGELANTILGSFFRALENEIGAFSLGIPSGETVTGKESVAFYTFLLDDHYPIEIIFFERDVQ